MSNIEIWNWDKKPRTMLRYIKVGDIVCFEIDSSGSMYGYGQIIAELTFGHAFKAFNICHKNPDDITIAEIKSASSLGKIFILDVYSTLDYKKNLQNGEWRVIGRENDFKLMQKDLETVFFKYGVKGMQKKINLLNETTSISDAEADNYLDYSPTTGDEAKMWFLTYDQ